MGYIAHNVIVATCWRSEAIDAFVDFARSTGAEVLVGGEKTNGYRTAIVTPDGSKEGWRESDDGDAKREAIRGYLRAQNEHPLEWFEAEYGHDPDEAKVTDSEWEKEVTP